MLTAYLQGTIYLYMCTERNLRLFIQLAQITILLHVSGYSGKKACKPVCALPNIRA